MFFLASANRVKGVIYYTHALVFALSDLVYGSVEEIFPPGETGVSVLTHAFLPNYIRTPLIEKIIGRSKPLKSDFFVRVTGFERAPLRKAVPGVHPCDSRYVEGSSGIEEIVVVVVWRRRNCKKSARSTRIARCSLPSPSCSRPLL
jgi:hypothetical protein